MTDKTVLSDLPAGWTGGAPDADAFHAMAQAALATLPDVFLQHIRDVVIAVDGRPVRSATDFRNRIGLLRVGTPVQLTVMREGGQKSVTVRTQR